MLYLTTHSTHFIYSYMASDIWLRTIQIEREETRCRLIGYSFRLTARVLLYTSSHRQDDTYHGLCYASRGALAGTRNKLLTHLNVEFLERRILLLVDLRERRIERHCKLIYHHIIIMQKGRWDMSPFIPQQSTPISLRSRKRCSNFGWHFFLLNLSLIKRNVLPFDVLHFLYIKLAVFFTSSIWGYF